jgi:hypothetical protein
MNRTLFIILATIISSTVSAQEKHSLTLQGAAFINKTIAEEKVKDIYQSSLIYSYRISEFIEFGAGWGMGKGRYITQKEYYFAKETDGSIYPYPISGNFIGYNTVRCNFYDIFARAKLILYDGIISPFFLIDVGYSFTPYQISNFNLKGIYFTTAVGYDIRIFPTGKIVMIAGSDYQKIKYEKFETYFDVTDPDNPEPIQGDKNLGLKDKYLHGLKLSLGFIYNPVW